jgi:hypothetical protein
MVKVRRAEELEFLQELRERFELYMRKLDVLSARHYDLSGAAMRARIKNKRESSRVRAATPGPSYHAPTKVKWSDLFPDTPARSAMSVPVDATNRASQSMSGPRIDAAIQWVATHKDDERPTTHIFRDLPLNSASRHVLKVWHRQHVTEKPAISKRILGGYRNPAMPAGSEGRYRTERHWNAREWDVLWRIHQVKFPQWFPQFQRSTVRIGTDLPSGEPRPRDHSRSEVRSEIGPIDARGDFNKVYGPVEATRSIDPTRYSLDVDALPTRVRAIMRKTGIEGKVDVVFEPAVDRRSRKTHKTERIEHDRPTAKEPIRARDLAKIRRSKHHPVDGTASAKGPFGRHHGKIVDPNHPEGNGPFDMIVDEVRDTEAPFSDYLLVQEWQRELITPIHPHDYLPSRVCHGVVYNENWGRDAIVGERSRFLLRTAKHRESDQLEIECRAIKYAIERNAAADYQLLARAAAFDFESIDRRAMIYEAGRALTPFVFLKTRLDGMNQWHNQERRALEGVCSRTKNTVAAEESAKRSRFARLHRALRAARFSPSLLAFDTVRQWVRDLAVDGDIEENPGPIHPWVRQAIQMGQSWTDVYHGICVMTQLFVKGC